MAIKVSGVNVIDNQRNANVGILTATSIDVPPQVSTFSPADGASGVLVDSNIVLTYNTSVLKGSGNILIKKTSAEGDTLETIAVSSGNVSVSGAQVTINPSSNLPTGNEIFVVIPEDAFTSSSLGSGTELLNTYNFSTGPVLPTSFSPSDGAADVDATSNITITFSENVAKVTTSGQKFIRIRSGGSAGSIQQSIDVASSAVSVSGANVTINPPSDMTKEIDTYIVVDSDSFFNTDNDTNSGNATINTYNFTTEDNLGPGVGYQGGTIICQNSGIYWIVASASAEVTRQWYQYNDAKNRAQSVTGYGGWFTPTCAQLLNPGYECRIHWAPQFPQVFWSSTQTGPAFARAVDVYNGYDQGNGCPKPNSLKIRAFRCVSY